MCSSKWAHRRARRRAVLAWEPGKDRERLSLMNTLSFPARSISATLIATVGVLALSVASLGASPSPGATDRAGATCGTTEPGAVGAIDHPTDPDAIVLQMLVGGGFVPVEYAFIENPTFTLYGNNVAMFRSDDESTDSIYQSLAPFACALLTPDEVDALLTNALDAGGLRDARDSYPNPYITDVPSTTFTIDADGVDKVVSVQGLGFDEGAPDPDARAAFRSLADELTGFASQVEDPQLYEVPAYRSMLTKAWPELEGTPVAWPWEDVSPADYGKDRLSTVVLTPEQVGQVTTVPNGGQAYILLDTPNGKEVALTISPILP